MIKLLRVKEEPIARDVASGKHRCYYGANGFTAGCPGFAGEGEGMEHGGES